MISLVSVIVFIGVLFYRPASKSNPLSVRLCAARIFVLPNFFFFPPSRFLAFRADNGALCLTAEIVYCFPSELVFNCDSFLFLIYWPFCFNFLFFVRCARRKVIRPVGGGTLASVAVKVSRDKLSVAALCL